jgi:hypothetical protein
VRAFCPRISSAKLWALVDQKNLPIREVIARDKKTNFVHARGRARVDDFIHRRWKALAKMMSSRDANATKIWLARQDCSGKLYTTLS